MVFIGTYMINSIAVITKYDLQHVVSSWTSTTQATIIVDLFTEWDCNMMFRKEFQLTSSPILCNQLKFSSFNIRLISPNPSIMRLCTMFYTISNLCQICTHMLSNVNDCLIQINWIQSQQCILNKAQRTFVNPPKAFDFKR